MKKCCFGCHILAPLPRLTLFASCESQKNHMNQGVNWCKTTWEGCEESAVFYQRLLSYFSSSDPVWSSCRLFYLPIGLESKLSKASELNLTCLWQVMKCFNVGNKVNSSIIFILKKIFYIDTVFIHTHTQIELALWTDGGRDAMSRTSNSCSSLRQKHTEEWRSELPAEGD